ncbi:hypothetical protein AAHH17_22610 [Lysinibacillus capsici]|uniref:hypothetical protein n=1 Tax=Lysinibacillus capsici TaxID=2115968 RepID=UPI0032E3C5AF
MRKLTLTLALSLFAVSAVGNTALASTEAIETPVKTLTEIESVANYSESIELINVNELPVGTPIVNFDTVEDFEKAVKELDEENKDSQFVNESQDLTISNHFITTMAATSSTTDRLTVYVKPSLNPIKSATQPSSVTCDLTYSYTGNGSSKTFSEILDVSSFSLGVPTSWVQTKANKSFYSFKKGVSIELLGYNLVGVSVGGLEVGVQVRDEITFNYRIDGSKTVFE